MSLYMNRWEVKKSKSVLPFITIISGLAFLFVVITSTIFGMLFDMGCEMYLKRAADANTITLASQQLDRAISYIEEHNLTVGYTGVIFNTAKGDLSFWYQNLKASREALDTVTDKSSPLEVSNVLMKLRETLMDGTEITVPPNTFVYPYQTLLVVICLVSLITLIISAACLVTKC